MNYTMLLDMSLPKGFVPWNKGLTKSDNAKIATQANGKSIWWKNLKENDPARYKELCQKTGGKSKGRPGLKLEKSPVWKGGRRVDKRDGYVLIQMPTHPDARQDGSILEHRLVMGEILGRRLEKDEDVNHVNGNKSDNRPENLKLVRHSAHYEPHVCPKCEFNWWTR